MADEKKSKGGKVSKGEAKGKGAAVETPIGHVPAPGALDLTAQVVLTTSAGFS